MKKYKIISAKKLKAMAKKSDDSWLDGWNGDLEGSYMESLFGDCGNAVPLGKKKHLWIRATPLNNCSVLFLRKDKLDEVISKLDINAMKQRKKDLADGTVERENYPTERYYDLVDKHIFKMFPEYANDLQNSYVNLYDYILNETIYKKE